MAAVFRKGEVLVPRGDTVLAADDEVLAIAGSGGAVAELAEKLK